MTEKSDTSISYSQVHTIIQNLGLSSNRPGTNDVVEVASAIGQTRPAVNENNPHELTAHTNRKNQMIHALWDMQLYGLRSSEEDLDRELVSGKEKWQKLLAIKIADRQIVEMLEPDLLIVLEVIVSGRYMFGITSEISALSDEQFPDLAAKAILDLVITERKKRGHPVLTSQTEGQSITTGTEIEISNVDWSRPLLPSEEVEQTNRIDSLLQLGIPITAEPNFRTPIREIPLPYSSAQDQIRAIFNLYRTGVLESKQRLFLHLNIGNLGNKIDDDVFLLHDALLMSQALGSTDRFDSDNRVTPILYPEMTVGGAQPYEVSGRKSLFPNDPASPKGLPFKQRDDGKTLELRYGFEVHGEIRKVDGSIQKSNLSRSVRDSANLLAMCHALQGSRATASGKTDWVSEELSSAWKEFSTHIKIIQNKHIFPVRTFHQRTDEYLNIMSQVFMSGTHLDHVSDEDFLANYGIEKNRFVFHMNKLEENYGRVETLIINAVKAPDSEVEQLTRLALKQLRLRVRRALMSAPERVSGIIDMSMTAS